jgi:hypothetical protein
MSSAWPSQTIAFFEVQHFRAPSMFSQINFPRPRKAQLASIDKNLHSKQSQDGERSTVSARAFRCLPHLTPIPLVSHLENLQVAFNCNLFLLLVAAFLPAVVKAMEVETTVSQPGEPVEIVFSGTIKAAEAAGTIDEEIKGAFTLVEAQGGRKLLAPNGHRDLLDTVEFDFNAMLSIAKNGLSADVFTASFNVMREGGVATIPVTLTITAEDAPNLVKSTSIGPTLAVADGSGTLQVLGASLTTTSIDKNRFTKFEFSIDVYYDSNGATDGYELLENMGVVGDPHFITWAGGKFDYQGQCELTLLRAPRVDLAVHIRTKIRYSYSYIER